MRSPVKHNKATERASEQEMITRGVLLFLLLSGLACVQALLLGDQELPDAPFDPQFSSNACIVYGDYTPPDCSLAPPDRFLNDTGPVFCPGYPDDDDPVAVLPEQIVYENIVDAIENCPYDPVLIEFTGTQYVYDGYGVFEGLFYNQTKDIIIRGIDFVTSSGGQVIQVLQNVTHYNTTIDPMTNMTVNITYTTLEPVNITTPIVNVTQQATIVGFYQWQVDAQNISVTLDNVYWEGCGAELPFFLTEAKPLRCIFPEPPIECCGAYFRQVDAEYILNNGTCQRTGAYFDGYRALVTTTNRTAWTFQNQVTLEAWVRPDSTATIARHSVIVGIGYQNDDNDNDSWGVGLEWLDEQDENGNDIVQFSASANGHFGTGSPLVQGPVPRGQWTHIAGTWTPLPGNTQATQTLYINGEVAVSRVRNTIDLDYQDENGNGVMIGRGFDLSSGASGSYKYFNGTIDEVRIWKVSRTQSQIQALRYTVVTPEAYPDELAGYWRFDLPHEGEPDQYLNNWVADSQGRADLETSLVFRMGGGLAGMIDPPAIPDCFCENPHGLCVASDLFQEFPFEAVLTDYMDTCLISDNCTFVHGMLIDPNGEYGRLWLPGLKQITGPSYNETIRFIPGRFEEQPYFVEVFNMTTNMTMGVENGTQPVFVPGAVADDLPYADFYVYNDYPGFMPGWFLNDGFAPYWTGNFVPGMFFPADVANMTYNMPYPVDWEPGDLVLVPGYRENDGSFYTIGDGDFFKDIRLGALRTLLIMVGGIAYNFDKDTEPCELPPPPEMVEAGMNMTLLEDEFGCLIVPGQEEPGYLDPSARDPCSVLAHIRSFLPPGTEVLPAEFVLGCNMSALIEEPAYLDPSKRDPCFVLKELRDMITPNDTFRADCVAAGGTVAEPEFMPCLRNQNLTIIGSTFHAYHGKKVVCQHSCNENTNLLVEYSVFTETPGSALYSTGLQNYNVHDNIFCPCGGIADCVLLNANYITQDEFAVYNNRQCGIADLAPVSCDYDISTVVRCQQGQLYCLNALATQLAGCPFLAITDEYGQYDNDCAVYEPCDFPTATQTVTLGNGQQVTFNTTAGDIVIDLPFLTPVLEELTGGNTSLVIPCVETNNTISYTYECIITVEVEVNNTGPYMNETGMIMMDVLSNCTEEFQIPGCAAAGDLLCPCPFGWDPTQNVTGVGSAGTTLTECDIPIPGAPAGETCVDRVVWCPYEGGTYGTGEPPPVPVGECADGQAIIECNNATCVNNTIYYEGVYHPCDLSSCNATGYTTVPCLCDDGSLEVVCDRTTCIGTPCVLNATLPYGGTRCEVADGMLDWDFMSYPCYLPENETLCTGVSYAPPAPAPPDGFLTLPCDNSYEVPGPGPCSCAENLDIGNNQTVVGNNTNPGYVSGDNTTATLACQVDGTLSCRCDTAEATNNYLANLTLSCPPDPNACAFRILHLPANPDLWFQQNNVAQDLPYGWCYEQFGLRHDSGWDVIRRFALKVPHYYTGHGIIYESRRLSPQISGTVYDWVDGHPNQWNRRWCDPSLGEVFDPCYQYRPLPITEACLVNRLYHPATPGWGVTHYNRIQDAISGNMDEGIAQCALSAVIVEKSENFYEERLTIQRDNFWLGSYDRAVIDGSNHRLAGNFLTLRGIVWLHPNTNDFPILVPANPSSNFDSIQDRLEEGEQGTIFNSLTLQNNEMVGDGVNDIGALVGVIGDNFRMEFNLIRSFFVRAIDISAQNGTIVRLNTFRDLTGRAFRGRAIQSIVFEENLFQECVGLNEGADVDIVSIEARTPDQYLAAPASEETILAMLNFQLGMDYDEQAFNSALNPEDIPADADIGCNPAMGYLCTFRGNRHAVTDEQLDRSTVVYSFTRGGWMWENIRDNTAVHGHIGMKFVETPFISFAQRSDLFLRNALVRVSTTRQLLDRPYDFAFQPPGQLQWVGCAFPDCLDVNLFYPPMEVNPRYDLIITDYFGFAYEHNVTQCDELALELSQPCVLTSGYARLRREDMFLRRDIYAYGVIDFPCCEKPVIQGNHLILADLTALETIEFWYYFDLNDFEPGFELFRTQDEFSAYQIFFADCMFDGRYYLYEFRSRMIDVHMREEDGDFAMVNCQAYNWWHYPDNTQLGFIQDESHRGIIGVVFLPNGDIFKWERSPDMDAVTVRYRPYTVVDINPFVIPQSTDDSIDESEFEALVAQLGSVEAAEQYVETQDGRTRLPIPPPSSMRPESFFTIDGCYFRDFDGNVIRAAGPGNIFYTNNVLHDCGMRQYEEQSLQAFELNPDSLGDYVWENNYANQTKPFLFPFGGGDGNKIRFACMEIYEAGRPRRFRVFNTTCVLLLDQETGNVFLTADEGADRIELAPKPARSDGLFADPFGFNSVETDDIEPFDTTLEDITRTNLKPALSDEGFQTSENTRVLGTQDETIQYATGFGTYQLDTTQRGYTVGLRLYAIDRDTILKTLTPGRQNTTLFPFFQPGLYPLRVLANEFNSINSTLLFAEGVYTPETLPTNGPGIQGMNADIIYCAGYEDAMDNMFQECAVCNDGCPVIPPDTCIVDPYNDTFVPENPYYNRWIFTSINSAVRECRDPNRLIKLVRQPLPYQLPWDISTSNWTIFSEDGAEVDVKQHSVLIGGNDLLFRNITFYHRLADLGPTLQSKHGHIPRDITFEQCTFDGLKPKDSTAPAIDGYFENFAMVDCEFRNYGGDYVVRVDSTTGLCSIFEADDNRFFDVQGNAIYARGFDMAIVQQNKFMDSGGRRADITSVVYLEMCLESMVELVFSGNWQGQDPDDVLYPMSTEGVYVAAYWIDGVSNQTGVVLNLDGNEADGLPIGMRVTNFQRQSNAAEGGDPRQDVRWVYAWNRNIAVYGTWHFIVVLPDLGNSTVAYFDQLIDADPAGTIQYYCDADCGGVGGASTSLIIFLATIACIFLALSVCICGCFMVDTRFGGFVYSPALESSYPADSAFQKWWVRLNVGNQGTNPNAIEPYRYTDRPRDTRPEQVPVTRTLFDDDPNNDV